jgi:PAS domain S-box-containing protein
MNVFHQSPHPTDDHYRALLDAIDEGFCVIDVIFDGPRAVDYRFVEVNAAFEQQTGLRAAVGRRMRELAPTHEEYWFETYGRVARTREPVRFENWAGQLGRWFDVYAFPIDHGQHDRVGILFRDVTRRKRADDDVRASEARFRELADAAPAMLWVTESDGACSFLSRAWYEFTGQAEATGLGFGWLDAVHPDDRTASRDAFLAANARREPFALEHRVRRADGVYRWVIDAGRPRVGDRGEPLGYIGAVIDIDDRRRVENELFVSREALRAVLDTIPQRVFWKGLDLTYLGCNRPFARDMGYDSPAEVVGKNDHQATWALAADDFRADDRRVIDTLTPKLDFDEVLPRGDGSRAWVRTSKVPLCGPDGRVIGVLGTYEDVTERHRLAEQLREQERLLREAAEMAHVGGWSFDPATLEGDWTAETARIHGLDPTSEASVRDGLARFPPGDRERIGAAVQAARERGTPYDLELNFIAADGVKKRVRAICRPVVEEGKVVRVRGSLQDVTERHRLEERLRQAQKMDAFGQLAGGVAHDFNNMLTVINGYAAELLKGMRPDDPMAEPVREIRQAGQRSAALTRQLLAFARQEVVAPRVLDVSAVAADTSGMLQRLIGEDVRLVTDLRPGVWPVLIDPGQLEQVLLNLAVNARDAMPAGGTLTVSTRNEGVSAGAAGEHSGAMSGPHAVLSVADTGTGMSSDVLARLFEPFFTTKEVGKGTGLGLATVYGIVRQAGGHMRVRSAVGEGSTFDVYLPRTAEVSADASAEPGATGLPRGRETVLVVEDEKAVRVLVKVVLSGCGYAVLEAEDAAAAERLAAGHAGPIHLVLCDVVMPGAGGRVAAEGVRAKHPEARVVFMSGYTDDAMMRQGVRTAEVAFLTKPFSPAALAAKVRQVLDAPR